MFTDKAKNEIEDKILSYCEGITHVEFNINDIGKMINDIETVVKNNDLLHNVSTQRETFNTFFEYLDNLTEKEYDSNSLTGHSENYLKSI